MHTLALTRAAGCQPAQTPSRTQRIARIPSHKSRISCRRLGRGPPTPYMCTRYSRADSNFCCVYFFSPVLILLLLPRAPLTHPTTYCIDRLLDASLAAFASLADVAALVYPRRRRKYWKNLFPAGERMCWYHPTRRVTRPSCPVAIAHNIILYTQYIDVYYTCVYAYYEYAYTRINGDFFKYFFFTLLPSTSPCIHIARPLRKSFDFGVEFFHSNFGDNRKSRCRPRPRTPCSELGDRDYTAPRIYKRLCMGPVSKTFGTICNCVIY